MLTNRRQGNKIVHNKSDNSSFGRDNERSKTPRSFSSSSEEVLDDVAEESKVEMNYYRAEKDQSS